jgi:cellulose synthase/poly-beta-1,6-N-acetylglucosamine synthase-like glycosyltransferase
LGKATAINSFLKIAKDPVVVVQSADTLPMEDTIEKLCRPFLIDKNIGMTGGAPIPLNDKNTFLGYVIHTWWWFHRRIPRFGEIIAFKNIIKEVSPRTAVDEAYIQAKFAQLGYKNVHIDEAKIFNKGSENIKDIVKQRRRIFNGHTRLNKEENIHISHVSKSGLKLLLFEYKVYGPVQFIWLCGGILIELWANVLGRYDKYVHKINPVAWEVAHSTKDLGVSKK